MAHAYAKGHEVSVPIETFKSLGTQIGHDLQFLDKGGGCDTLAGQLQDNRIQNRDCKLPTLLLALAWNDTSPETSANIVFTKQNPAHPYVHTFIKNMNIFGHFTKPRPNDPNSKSQFELLDRKETEELVNFISRDRTITFGANLEGMREIDKLFITI